MGRPVELSPGIPVLWLDVVLGAIDTRPPGGRTTLSDLAQGAAEIPWYHWGGVGHLVQGDTAQNSAAAILGPRMVDLATSAGFK